LIVQGASLFATVSLLAGCGSAGHGHEPDLGWPAGASGATDAWSIDATGMIGDPCLDVSTCPAGGSGTVVCLGDTYSGGYCSVANCATHVHDCPGDAAVSKCVLAPAAICLRLCETDANCRPGYACLARADAAGHGSAKVCIPN
jgi:hypothetical protein